MASRAGTIVVVALVGMLAACAGPADRPLDLRAGAEPAIVWPSPPMLPRIRLVTTVARPKDLGASPSVWKRIRDTLAGGGEDWFVRPTGVAANGRLLCVADPGAQSLWIIEAAQQRFQRVQDTGGVRLISPVAVALAPDDRVFLVDSGLKSVLVLGADGTRQAVLADPRFQRPSGVAYDGDRDRLYVADSAAHTVFVLTGDGRAVATIGRRGGGNGEFNFPTHVTTDRAGALYVTDALGFRVQMFDREGRFTGQFGRQGDASGEFASPKGVALDSEGHVYVVDALFDVVQMFDRDGRYLMAFGERGGRAGQFWLPGGVAIDGTDRVYVADSYNRRVQIFQYLAGGGDD
jgi:DNA-binding beta-propeller fold protein YncE